MMVFNCKACGKPIVFITTVAGKKMPCDAMVRAYEPDGAWARLSACCRRRQAGAYSALGKLPRRRRTAQNAESEVIFAETLNLR